MDFRQITMMQKIKSGMDRFRANHPKFPMFLRAVSQDALVEGTIIEIKCDHTGRKKILYQCQVESR
mgnify:CR=1 FL=1